MVTTGNYTNAISGAFSQMSPFTSLTSLGKGVGDAVNDITGTSANNAFNALEAQKQRNWEERMSNTQYQRTVSDMKRAGINPAALMSGAQLTSLGSSQAATSGSGSNLVGTLLNALIGAFKGSKGGKVTINKYYQ